MSKKNRSFKVGSDIYDIPQNEVDAFLKDAPEAIEVKSFVVEKDTYDIPLEEVDQFQAEVPEAQELGMEVPEPQKKKDWVGDFTEATAGRLLGGLQSAGGFLADKYNQFIDYAEDFFDTEEQDAALTGQAPVAPKNKDKAPRVAESDQLDQSSINAIMKTVAEMPENVRNYDPARSAFVAEFSKANGFSTDAVLKYYNLAKDARAAIDRLEIEVYGTGEPPVEGEEPWRSHEGGISIQRMNKRALPMEPIEKFKKMYELAGYYNTVGDYERAKNMYSFVERSLYDYGNVQMQDPGFRETVPPNYVEQLQAPATQGLAYTAYLSGDREDSKRLYTVLKQKNLLHSGLPEVSGKGMMQDDKSVPSTFGFTGKRGTDTRPTLESEYLNDIAGAIEQYTLFKPALTMAEMGLEKTAEAGVELVERIPERYLGGSPDLFIKDAQTGLKLVTGLVESFAGFAGMTTPAGSVFALPFFQVQNSLPPEVAEYMMPISRYARNYYADKGEKLPEWIENSAVLADFALLAALHTGGNYVKGKVSTRVKAGRQAKIMDEILSDLPPETAEAIFSDIEKRWEASGKSPEIYAEQVKEKINEALPTLQEAEANLESALPVEPYEPPMVTESLGKLKEGTEVEYNGQVGVIERGEDMSWNVVYEDGTTVEIPVKNKTNATETLDELGITELTPVDPKQVAKAMADAEQTGYVEYKGKRYFVSLDRSNNPNPNGDFVLEQMSNGSLVDRFSSHRDQNFATDRKLAIMNTFLESKGLPRRTKIMEPWKEAERYKVENGAIAYEPETPNASGGKGQYIFYDEQGNPKVITEQEYSRLKEYGTPIKVKAKEGVEAEEAAISEETAGEEMEQKIRTKIRQQLIDLRNEGLLVSADKGVIQKAKAFLGMKTKKAPMSDMEIDGLMALNDALAKKWAKVSGKNDFYQKFVGDVEVGDLDMLRQLGGVLFQNASIPTMPFSRVTLEVFQRPEFQKMEGMEVNPQQIRDLMKSRGKPIEKNLIDMVLDMEKYQGKRRINYNDLKNDVELQIMKLERLYTDEFAKYGLDRIQGDKTIYGDADSIILNSPLEHGITGNSVYNHWQHEFVPSRALKIDWKLTELDTGQYAATSKEGYIGTAGTKEAVQNWIDQRKELSNEINKGMFGHIRRWFNRANKIWHLAEMQSDMYADKANNKNIIDHFNILASETKKLIREEAADKYIRAAIAEAVEHFDNSFGFHVERGPLRDSATGDVVMDDVILIKDNKGNIVQYERVRSNSNVREGYKSGEYEVMQALKGIADNFYDLTLDIETIVDGNGNEIGYKLNTERYLQARIPNIIETIKEFYFKDYPSKTEALDAARSEKALVAQENADAKELVENYFKDKLDIAEKAADIYSDKRIAEEKDKMMDQIQNDPTIKQFVNAKKGFDIRLLREAIQIAADEGADVFRFPDPFTEAVIQKYAVDTERVPYESFGLDQLSDGDRIRYEGNDFVVVDADPSGIKVVDVNNVRIYDKTQLTVEYIEKEIEYWDTKLGPEITYDQIISMDSYGIEGGLRDYLLNEYLKENKDLINAGQGRGDKPMSLSERKNDINKLIDDIVKISDTLVFDEISKKHYDYAISKDGQTFYGWGGYRDTQFFRQPDQYVKDFDISLQEGKLSKEQKFVVDQYKIYIDNLKKLRGDVVEVIDQNGLKWYETKIKPEDRSNPIVAFQKKGGKVKAAIDFMNDNKATVSIFDGADISSLVHEFTGHMGRRVLEKMAELDPQSAKDYEALKNWAGVKDNVWSTRAEEMFARGMERYLRSGVAPAAELEGVFKMMAKWMSAIYETIKDSDIDINLTPEVRGIFDRLLGGEDPLPTEPKVGDLVKIEPQKKGGMPREMVFTDKGWRQKVGDQEMKVGSLVQDMAQKAWEEGPRVTEAPVEMVAPEEPVMPARRVKTVEEIMQEKKNLSNIGMNNKSMGFSMPFDLIDGIKNMGKKLKEGFAWAFNNTGMLPKDIFKLEIKRKGEIAAGMTEVDFTIADLNRAVKKTYDVKIQDLPASVIADMNEFLTGNQNVNLPLEITDVLSDMRRQIDGLSRKIIKSGLATDALELTIDMNQGVYVTRSYRKWDLGEEWRKIVPEQIVNQAENWVRQEYPNLTDLEVEGLLNELLTAPGAPLSVIKGAKVGSKNLDILKGRKDIPAELRAYWGEYNDPVVNYMKSVQKMTTLIANDTFLNEVYNMGMGKYFFDKPTGESYQKISGEGTKAYSPLNGKYATPELVEALTLARRAVNNPNLWDKMFAGYMALNAQVKLGKTAHSPMTHTRNFLSNLTFIISNGHYLQPGNSIAAWKTVKALFNKQGDFAQLSYIQDLQKLGVLGENLTAEDIRAVIKDATNRYNDVGQYMQNSFLGRVNEAALKLYELEDSIYKVFAFECEKNRYMDAGYTYNEAMEIAAENVRNLYPTYSLIPNVIKELRNVPTVGTFVSFPAEVVRTYANTWALAVKEIKSGNPVLQKVGAARIAGTILTSIGIKGIADYTAYVYNVTKEEEEALRRFQPPWTKYSDYMYTGRNEKGIPVFIDFGGTDPYNYLKEPINTLIVEGPTVEGEDVAKAAYAIIKPFASEEMLFGRLADIRSNKKSLTGGPIYNQSAPYGDKVYQSVAYLTEVLEPGAVSQVRKIYKGYKGEKSETGRAYSVESEVLAVTTGQRKVETDIPLSLNFKAQAFYKKWLESKNIYNKAYYTTTDQEKLDEALVKANEARKEYYEELKLDYKAALTLGLSEDEILEIFEKNRVPKDVIIGVVYDDPYEDMAIEAEEQQE